MTTTILDHPVQGFNITYDHDSDKTTMRFSSLSDLSRFIQSDQVTGKDTGSSYEKGRTGDNKFHQHSATDTFRWLKSAGEGFPYTPDKTPIDLPLVTTMAESTTYTRQYGLRGVSPSTGRFIGGNPRCMAQNVAVTAQRKAIKILIDGSASAAVAPVEFTRQATAIMRVIEHYGALGYPLQIDIGVMVKFELSYDMNFEFLTTIKPMNARYSAPSIAYAVANRDYLRRIMFRAMEIAGKWSQGAKEQSEDNSYGYPMNYDPLDHPGVVVLKTYSESNKTQQQVTDSVIDAVKAVIQ